MKKYSFALICILTVAMPVKTVTATAIATPSHAATSDPSQKGPYQVAFGEYHLPASIDADVLPDRMTEVWGKMFYPTRLTTLDKAPLIVMLHGNHATCGKGSHPRIDDSCEYTEKGICPTGYVPVPNHEGYDYLAQHLASWGYLVVSVNANRGITCGGGSGHDYGLNLARGRLVLKHLSLLYQWSTQGDAPASLGLGAQGLIGKVNFGTVGLLGHSRGGEGIRAAYNLYLDEGSVWPAKIPGLSMKALYEIGAVDGQTSRVLDAKGAVWNQLLPMCDGDVSDLQGRYPFERMLKDPTEPANAQKSLYEVWGANHNFFNTEWQRSDSSGCFAGKALFSWNESQSPQQQQIALMSVSSFFRSHLGTAADAGFNQHFNPLNPMPASMTAITQIDRDFTPSPGAGNVEIVDDFDQETGKNSSGNANLVSEIRIQHQVITGSQQRAAKITWETSGETTYFEAVLAAPHQGRNIKDFSTLDFRIARQVTTPYTLKETTDFTIKLEDSAGHFSKGVKLSDYAQVNGPASRYEKVLQAVRIPLSAFQDIDLTKIHGVRFVFDRKTKDGIYLANIRIQKQWGIGQANFGMIMPMKSMIALSTNEATFAAPSSLERIPAKRNSMRVIHAKNLQGEAVVELKLASEVAFPVMNNLPMLKVGEHTFKLSRYSDMTTLKELTFTLSSKEYSQISQNSEVTVTNGKVWEFGKLAK